MKKIILLTLCGLPLVGSAQNETDALRYSWLSFGGSARYSGMAGAFGAVGGDMSCMAVNPAGMARFTQSEMELSFGITENTAYSSFNGGEKTGSRVNFTLNNLGIVGAYKAREDSDWKTIQFGLSYTKLANFSGETVISGNNSSTLLDVFADDAYGVTESAIWDVKPFTSGPAYYAYLIDPLDTVVHSYSTQVFNSDVKQTRTITRKGGVNETGLSLSANYLDKFYFGGTIGFAGVRYSEEYTHREDVVDQSLDLRNFTFKQSLLTRGIGINAKFGVIYLPAEWVRLGIAMHTRTGYSLSDRWSTEISSFFSNGDNYHEVSPVVGSYNYKVKAPSRFIGSLAFVFKKFGLVSVDYEMLDYSTALLKGTNYDPTEYSFNSENQAIKENYTRASNIRAGAEIRLKPFLIRGGYALYGSPFKSDKVMNDGTRRTITFGFGYRNHYFFADAGYVLTKWKEDYYMYDPDYTSGAEISNISGTVVLSCGFRF